MPIGFAFIITLSAAILWLRLNDFLAEKKIISNKLSRKIIHIGTGPIFVLCWLLFPETQISRLVAAIIPFLISIQFLLVGIGVIKDKASVDAMSRTGDPKEILFGPLFYGIVFVLITIIFWKDSLVGIIALMILCGGDGIADIVGRRVNSRQLPWSNHKTVVGSLGMFFGGFIFSFLISLVFITTLNMQIGIGVLVIRLIFINIVATLVESLPVKDIDNLTVPLIAILMGLLLF